MRLGAGPSPATSETSPDLATASDSVTSVSRAVVAMWSDCHLMVLIVRYEQPER
jgi:hypothetical protein